MADNLLTFGCLAASNWPPGHPRSDHHVSNPHRPGQVLEEAMDSKYLGVTLSNDLEWSKHIATMTNKANSKLSLTEGLPREA